MPPPYVVQVSSWESKIEERGFIPDAVCATYRNDSTIISPQNAQTDFFSAQPLRSLRLCG